ncbi:MAG: nucleoside hydrolase [Anaerolineaceae bacterium]|nr:nucleoside hydrolase [Anaerolineaceae bacterium]
MTRAFLIDTDTASDDAVALIMAAHAPDVDIKAVTIVSGNVSVEQGTRNALYTLELCGVQDVPVYVGADRPLLREAERAEWFHGADGMGNQNYAAPKGQPAPGHAVPAIIETIKANPGIVLVTLGPLTNIALALAQAPEIAPLVSRCVVMGGTAWAVGNVTPAAEFNVWQDPEAAQIMFRSGLPVEMVGWELCRFGAGLTPDEMAQLRQMNTERGHFTIDCNQSAIEAIRVQSGAISLELPDPVAMAVAIDPTICTRKSRHAVEVETHSELTRGMTVIDQLDNAGDERNYPLWKPVLERANITVCWEIDVPRWKAMLVEALR